MGTHKSLAELYQFGARSPILGGLNNLVRTLDVRLNALDEIGEAEKTVIDSILQIALDRMNEVFTPLILQAEDRLALFGAAFSAESDTNLVISAGAKVLVLTPETKEGWIIADYIGLTATSGGSSMLAKVDDYDRPTGQLFATVVSATGSGNHAGWHIRMSAAPDLAHAARVDNPHAVTAAQVGAYTTAAADAAMDLIFDAAKAYVDGLGFMRQSLNLSDLLNKAMALSNLGGQPILGFTPLNKAGDTATGQLAAPSFRSTGGNMYLSLDGTKYVQWSGAAYVTSQGTLMHRQDNLAGLSSLSTARANLGLGSAATVSSGAFQAAGTYLTPTSGLGNRGAPGSVGVDTNAGMEPGHHIQIYWDPSQTPALRWVVDEGGATGEIKTFVIDHPSDGKTDRFLVHACSEGPEASVFYRGRARVDDGEYTVIKLPDYFKDLVDPNSVTVQLTMIRERYNYVKSDPVEFIKIEGNELHVWTGTTTNDTEFFWRVEATRRDVHPLEVEPLRSSTDVLGSGPYTFTQKRRTR